MSDELAPGEYALSVRGTSNGSLKRVRAEARAELLADLRVKVEALPEILEVALPFSIVNRSAVLALLSADSGVEP